MTKRTLAQIFLATSEVMRAMRYPNMHYEVNHRLPVTDNESLLGSLDVPIDYVAFYPDGSAKTTCIFIMPNTTDRATTERWKDILAAVKTYADPPLFEWLVVIDDGLNALRAQLEALGIIVIDAHQLIGIVHDFMQTTEQSTLRN